MKNESKIPNAYEVYLQELLAVKNYLPGQEVVQHLIQRFPKVEPAHARKIMQRAVENGFLKSSAPFTFGKRQYIYLSPSAWLDKTTILSISFKYRPPLYRLLSLREENGGILSYYEGLKVTASPVEKTSSKVSSLNALLEILIDLKIAEIKNDENGVRYIIEKTESSFTERELVEIERALIKSHYSNMVTDCMFVPDILRWLKKINLLDSRNAQYRNKTSPSVGAEHNNLVWDAYSYTKTTGINPQPGVKADTPDKQTLVVLDVVMSREYTEWDLDGFLARIQLYINSVKTGVRKAMPVVVYRSCSPAALNRMNALGFLSFDIGIIFGTHIYQVADQLSLLNIKDKFAEASNIEATAVSMIELLRSSGQEDNLNEIKGSLFEALLYPLLKNLYPDAEVMQGRTLRKTDKETKEQYEYDYILRSQNPKELMIVELKGYSLPSVILLGDAKTKKTLRWFFRTTLPFAAKYFEKDIKEGYQLKACYITSAKFFPDGIQFLQGINSGSLKSMNMECYYDGEALLKLLDQRGFQKIKQTIEKYYHNRDNKST